MEEDEYDILIQETSMLFEGKNDQLTLTYEELRSIVRHAFNVGLNEGIDCIYDSEKREKYLVDDSMGTFYQDKRQ